MYGSNLTYCDNHKSGSGHRRVLWGCKTIAVMSWMQMRYAFWDPRDVRMKWAIKHFANMCRWIRDILRELYDPAFEKVNGGAGCSEERRLAVVWVARRPSGHFLTLLRHFILQPKHGSLSTVSVLLDDVLLHRRLHHSPLLRPQCEYIYQPNNWKMKVLRSSTIIFSWFSFMYRIATIFCTLPMMIPAILKPTARIWVSIQSNVQFGYVFMVIHTWTTIQLGSLLVRSSSISSTMKLIYATRVLPSRSID